jgi:hypothetical protein
MPVTLGSDWGAEGSGLNKHLIAKIYPVSSEGKVEVGEAMVAAPLTDGNLDLTINWQSPFENTGGDAKFSSISQLLQTGEASIWLNLLGGLITDDPDSKFAKLKNNLTSLEKEANANTGVTGITKLNSRQVFTGLPPIKIPITLYFRAWADPQKEVEAPINQLFAWALPQDLAEGSALLKGIDDLFNGNLSVKSVFPSLIPKFVALEYGGRTYKPLVIESIGHPLVLPRSKDGAMLSASVQLTLATLTAWGKDDYELSSSIPKVIRATTTDFSNVA